MPEMTSEFWQDVIDRMRSSGDRWVLMIDDGDRLIIGGGFVDDEDTGDFIIRELELRDVEPEPEAE